MKKVILIKGRLYPIRDSLLEYVKTEKGAACFTVGAGHNTNNFLITKEGETDSPPGFICFDAEVVKSRIASKSQR